MPAAVKFFSFKQIFWLYKHVRLKINRRKPEKLSRTYSSQIIQTGWSKQSGKLTTKSHTKKPEQLLCGEDVMQNRLSVDYRAATRQRQETDFFRSISQSVYSWSKIKKQQINIFPGGQNAGFCPANEYFAGRNPILVWYSLKYTNSDQHFQRNYPDIPFIFRILERPAYSLFSTTIWGRQRPTAIKRSVFKTQKVQP